MATGTDPTDPLEKAREALRALKDADDWDEPTGRTEVTVNLRIPSQPDIEAPKAKDDPPSLPPPVKAVTAVMDRLPPTHRWMVVVLAAAVAGLAGRQMGLW